MESNYSDNLHENSNQLYYYYNYFYYSDMENMMSLFGLDFAKTLQNKRKRLESFTNASLTSSDKKVKEMCQSQQAERLDSV